MEPNFPNYFQKTSLSMSWNLETLITNVKEKEKEPSKKG